MSVFPRIGRLCPLPFPYQHRLNPSVLPRPRSASACSPLNRAPGASSHRLLRRWETRSFRVPTHPHPEEFSRKLPNSFFDPRFFQTALASPPGVTTGLKAAESTPLESQWSAQAPECQRLLPPNRVRGLHPIACSAAGKPVLSVFRPIPAQKNSRRNLPLSF